MPWEFAVHGIGTTRAQEQKKTITSVVLGLVIVKTQSRCLNEEHENTSLLLWCFSKNEVDHDNTGSTCTGMSHVTVHYAIACTYCTVSYRDADLS